MEEESLQEKGNWILVITIALTIIGLIMIFSTSSVSPQSQRGMYYLLMKQSSWAIAGFLSIFIITKIKLVEWSKRSFWLLSVFLLLLFSTLFFPPKNGAKRWIWVRGLGCEPSEFVKVFFIFFLAKFFSEDEEMGFKKSVIPPCIVLAIILGILAVQPHRGMAGFFCALVLCVFTLVKVKIKHILILFLTLSVIMATIIGSKGYSKERIEKFIFKNGDRFYQLEQAEIALGAGGLFGVGLGESMQKLSCVPLPSSDFIFSIFGEECGFLGSFFLFALFALFAYLGFFIACHSESKIGFFLAFSLTFSIVFQVIINIAVVLECCPTTGLSLPFISYGGSSLFSNLISVGFIISCARAK